MGSQRLGHGLSDSHTHTQEDSEVFRQRGGSTKAQTQGTALDIGGKINTVAVV